MKIVHNIALSVSKLEKEDFAKAGIDLEEGFVSFRIDEADPHWNDVSKLVTKFRAVDTVETKFSRVEMESAKYLQMVPTWHHGYPEPSADFGYLHKTYETTNYCRVCGIGLNQVAPFRLKREPTWGKNSIFQLNWVFDEYFVKLQVSRALLNELEIGPVIGDKSGRDLADVVQFIVGGGQS